MGEMRIFLSSVTFAAIIALFGQGASGQNPPGTTNNKAAAPVIEAPPIPARPLADYQGHAPAGAVTVAGEFTGHSVVTPLATFTTEDYVAVEVAVSGAPGARATMSYESFSLRINGKKALPAQQYLLVFKSLKDPEYVPPDADKPKDKMGSGPEFGSTTADRDGPWHPVPFEVTHKMEVRVEKASLPEGDRALPEAGLIFFQYHGRENGINSVELIYTGPAGKAIVPLHP
jgi:hypothetical protein